jgi:hypothetical protein
MMWRWIAHKISPYLDPKTVVHTKEVVRPDTTSNPLMEEVFLLQDQLEAFAKYLGLQFIQDGENSRIVTSIPSEEEVRNFEVARNEVLTKNETAYISSVSKAFVTAVIAVEERRKARETYRRRV